jgi:N-acetylmuramoyl-L-alanine amidase
MRYIDRLSPHHSPRHGHEVQCVVMHGDAGKTDGGTLAWMEHPDSRVSYHWFIGRDGPLYRIVPEHRAAWHAGLSDWEGLAPGRSLNPVSVGICCANDGTGSEPYTDAQYRTAGRLLAAVTKRHRIRYEMVLGHFHVSPGRKGDPWDWFHWDRLKDEWATARGALI